MCHLNKGLVSKRTVQLGNVMFGVTKLQGCADVTADPDKTPWQRVKAAVWGLVVIAQDLLMVSGIAERLALKISNGMAALGRVGWVVALRTGAIEYVEEAIRIAVKLFPNVASALEAAGTAGRVWFVQAVEWVTTTKAWAKLGEWSTREIPLPRAIEVLSEDIRVLIGRRMSEAVPAVGAKTGLVPTLAGDTKGARGQRVLAAAEAEPLAPAETAVSQTRGSEAGATDVTVTDRRSAPVARAPRGGFRWRSDHGRPISAQGWVLGQAAPRDEAAQAAVRAGMGNNIDAGHLIPSRFGGPGGVRNLVPVDSRINRSYQTTMENQIKRLLDGGKDVYMEVWVDYPDNGRMPSVITCRLSSLQPDLSLKMEFEAVFNATFHPDVAMGKATTGKLWYQLGKAGTVGDTQ